MESSNETIFKKIVLFFEGYQGGFNLKFNSTNQTSTEIFFQSDDINLIIVLYPNINKIPEDQREGLEDAINNLIIEDPSHLVTGACTLANIKNRPSDIYVVFRNITNKMLLFIADISPRNQVILFGSKISDRPLKELITRFISEFSLYHFYCSGGLLTNIPNDVGQISRKKENFVYLFQHFSLDCFKLLEDTRERLKFCVFNDGKESSANNPGLLEKLRNFYNYDLTPDKLIVEVRRRPHILVFENEIAIGAARVNEISKFHIVIGGIHVLPNYRNRGVGQLLCSHFIASLHLSGKQIILETATTNHSAQRIYEKIGFKKVGNSVYFLFQPSNAITSK